MITETYELYSMSRGFIIIRWLGDLAVTVRGHLPVAAHASVVECTKEILGS
jgi:hypothetical protein